MSAASAASVERYAGICDASAADALDAAHFVVASDEDDALRIYRRGSAEPVGVVDLARFLGTPRGREADIEGAARISTRIFWITSHGRNADGEPRPERARFFATDVRAGEPPSVVPVGAPYDGLLRDLVAAPTLARYRLDVAAQRAPESDGGLNIEGLAATPQGHLLIGFRSPLVGDRALLATLENPVELIDGQRARIGAPIELDLGGRGVREIARIGDAYIIVAGPVADSGTFALFRWSGEAKDPPVRFKGADLDGFNPEAIFSVPGTDGLQLLSDDGGVKTSGIECKRLPPGKRSFRSRYVTP